MAPPSHRLKGDARAPEQKLARSRGASLHAHMDAYRRLAAIDPPVLRSLIVELKRVSDESAASAEREGTAEAVARADRNADRADAARAALDLVQT